MKEGRSLKKIGLFPGSFDPFTKGHLNTVERASKLFDEVIIGIFINTSKKSFFSAQEKKALVEQSTTHLTNVRVITQETKLTVELAKELQADFLIRGIRNSNDYEYEKDIQQLNNDLDNEIDTVFFLSDNQYAHTSSSMIKEIFHFGGNIAPYVPSVVLEAMFEKRRLDEEK
jgi:pantetheine-phosphate adenylyltransferase